jgi:hypothetical protein
MVLTRAVPFRLSAIVVLARPRFENVRIVAANCLRLVLRARGGSLAHRGKYPMFRMAEGAGKIGAPMMRSIG